MVYNIISQRGKTLADGRKENRYGGNARYGNDR